MANMVPFRLLRSLLITLTTVSLAGTAHAAAGGGFPAAPLLLGMTALTWLGCMLVSRWRLSVPAMAVLLAGSQVALHQGFEWFAMSGDPIGGTIPAGHPHGTAMNLPDLDFSASAATPEHASSTAMLMMHVLATAVTAVLLARGEAALWTLSDWLRPLLQPARPVPLPAATRPASIRQVAEAAAVRWILSANRWRGPPPAPAPATASP